MKPLEPHETCAPHGPVVPIRFITSLACLLALAACEGAKPAASEGAMGGALGMAGVSSVGASGGSMVTGGGGGAGTAAMGGSGGGAGTSSMAGQGGAPVDATPPKPAFDWVGVIGTGQSLSVGAEGNPMLSKTQPFKNLKLDLGGASVPPFDAEAAALKMVPLVEPIRPLAPTYPGPYPANIYGETPHTAMANQISAAYAEQGGGDYITVHSVIGESGQSITALRKGAVDDGMIGRAYAATLFEVSAIHRLAVSAGKTYGVGAIILTHGEADSGRPSYGDDVHQLWQDYNSDLRAITGQVQPIPLLVTQQSSISGGGFPANSTLAVWQLGVEHPGDIICVGPKYQYEYAPDNVHLTAAGYVSLGQKYAEVFYEVVARGHAWQPLQPKSVQKTGKLIRVELNVPVPPLLWDEAITPPHQSALTEWGAGRGFEVQDSNGRVAIESVKIADSAVEISLATDSTGAGLAVRYAMSLDDPNAKGGRISGRRGQLKDSDTFAEQANYCVSFELPVP